MEIHILIYCYCKIKSIINESNSYYKKSNNVQVPVVIVTMYMAEEIN